MSVELCLSRLKRTCNCRVSSALRYSTAFSGFKTRARRFLVYETLTIERGREKKRSSTVSFGGFAFGSAYVRMKSIEHLPTSVHSSLRSSMILFDLPRVVEELVSNSVDASASKVYVSLSIGACYIKVEDDGCGITRDGLVLLGERLEAAKVHLLVDMETKIETLGIRGEALGSLSDVSLVEVITKARGRPNGYRKVIKGWKCLFLGIDDHRHDVGTTVIVRDLFYNQPIRRKYMQSSHKKVLHSVKKCVIRTALAHPQVSFKVTDIESEDELLCTIPCSSPLPLVSDSFGNEISDSLHEIIFSDQGLKISGYLSGPTDTFSTKAFQYLYINSRFVSKGQIHKLLDNLAASICCSLTLQRAEPEFSKVKRNRTQGYPAYILNLCCPFSRYDLTSEPSKTIVEFKDWATVLSFIEQAVNRFWEQFTAGGTSSVHNECIPIESKVPKEDMFTTGISKGSETRKRKCDIQFCRSSVCHSSFANSLEIPSEPFSVYRRSPAVSHRFSSGLKPCQSETGYVKKTDNLFRDVTPDARDVLDSTHDQLFCANSCTDLCTPDPGFFLAEGQFLSDQTCKVNEKNDMLGLVWKYDSPEGSRSSKKESTQSLVTCDPYYITNNAQEFPMSLTLLSGLSKPSLRSSSLLKNERENSVSNRYHSQLGGVEFGDFLGGREHFPFDDTINDLDAEYGRDSCRESFNFSMETPCQGKVAASKHSFTVMKKFQSTTELDVASVNLKYDFAHDQACPTEENILRDGLTVHVPESGSNCKSTETGCCFGSRHSVYGESRKMFDDLTDSYVSEGNLRSFRSPNSSCSGTTGANDEFLSFIQTSFNEEGFDDTGCLKSTFDYKYCFSPEKNVQYRYPSDEINFGEVRSTGYGKMVESPRGDLEFQHRRQSHLSRVRSRRSCSAPPFYKGKSKFPILNDHLIALGGKEANIQFLNDAKTLPEAIFSSTDLSQPFCTSQTYLEPILDEGSQPCFRKYTDEKPSAPEMNRMRKCGGLEKVNAVEDLVTDELEYTKSNLTKWRTGNLQPTVKYANDFCIPSELVRGVLIRLNRELSGYLYQDRDVQHSYPNHKDDILDISSGLLHLAGTSLVPESINKDCLDDARVLLQLDRKFIPVMAGGSLIIIDQHAADERIRLEELRRKVLSGEGKRIVYLDSEQELVLPEIGFQLLQNYAEQIQKWGWMCNIHSQCSESFTKNLNFLKRRPFGVTLIAVPCILGINLTDKDLIEFIEQLAETDGSSTLPPSVLRVLNFKACRGAIMFGDSLLPSECSLIVEELKATSLCFQCAHGRPTTVPLLNMASLHEQLAKLELQKGDLRDVWHGLRQERPSIERAQLRLSSSAKRFHNG